MTDVDVAALTPSQAREVLRTGHRAPTAGWCKGWTQANLVAVPADLAYDLLLFAQRNPKPCPVLDVSDAGARRSRWFAGDLATDLGAYRVYEDGRPVADVSEVADLWRPDLVSFLIGCSFTFEAALLSGGVPVRHLEVGANVPMYRTNRPTEPAGRLHGPLVVSMRPIPAAHVADAVRITSRYPGVHGAPVHVGDPQRLGISDLGQPDFGDAVPVRSGDIPVFWACGVTPQAVVMASGVQFAISHSPGHMAITDLRDDSLLTP